MGGEGRGAGVLEEVKGREERSGRSKYKQEKRKVCFETPRMMKLFVPSSR